MDDGAKHGFLVSTEWLADHLDHPDLRVVEVDVDTSSYDEGHIPGAVGWNWKTDLCDTVEREIAPRDELEELLERSGISNDTTIVLYGDNDNWFACWAFWQLEMYGHEELRILDGGRKKWLAERRPTTAEVVAPERGSYRAPEPDESIRAFLPEVRERYAGGEWKLVDVRSPAEYSGEILAPPGLPETCQRGGHIPGAINIPWGMNCAEDGTFKDADELEDLYESKGVTASSGVISYCRIGERSSLTWVVLRHILGHPRVLNYDGSWTEWGNLVGAPVQTGSAP